MNPNACQSAWLQDKFRVEALTMPPGVHEASSELFHANKQAVE